MSAWFYEGHVVQYAKANIAASSTASSIVAAVTGKRIRVLGFVVMVGDTATDVTFNSASTAISPVFQCAANGGVAPGDSKFGWFQTVAAEALTVTTGTGSDAAILVSWVAV